MGPHRDHFTIPDADRDWLTARLGLVRKSALADGVEYADVGCGAIAGQNCVHALECPFKACALELPAGRRSAVHDRDRNKARSQRRAGQKIGAIATNLHLTKRTIYRMLRP
jgi:hypothetical protein